MRQYVIWIQPEYPVDVQVVQKQWSSLRQIGVIMGLQLRSELIDVGWATVMETVKELDGGFYLLVPDLSQFGRVLSDVMASVKWLYEQGVKVVYLHHDGTPAVVDENAFRCMNNIHLMDIVLVA